MKIIVINNSEVKLFLANADLEKLGIDFEAFEHNNITAQLFISNIISVLKELNIFEFESDDIVCDITEKSDGLTVHIKNENPKEKDTNISTLMFTFKSSAELIRFTNNLDTASYKRITNDELYKYKDKYILIISFSYAMSTIYSRPNLRGGKTDVAKINKIREYAEILSAAPLKLISDISDNT